ncbi:hypothetical protein MasN3_20310 [Massilia varians]|uniref:Uncharacterized protein n=1 Tax=Massilia varians TaxID=457921 RepID=A0ABN6T8H1_9BURK|nr:hypothetical protein MasN3_20310 [Massilia varians]
MAVALVARLQVAGTWAATSHARDGVEPWPIKKTTRSGLTLDSRGFFMLPRSPVESGYYTYGTMDKKPDRGGYQYPHPIMMQAILRVALEWQAIDRRRIGIGNISRAEGFYDGEHREVYCQ